MHISEVTTLITIPEITKKLLQDVIVRILVKAGEKKIKDTNTMKQTQNNDATIQEGREDSMVILERIEVYKTQSHSQN